MAAVTANTSVNATLSDLPIGNEGKAASLGMLGSRQSVTLATASSRANSSHACQRSVARLARRPPITVYTSVVRATPMITTAGGTSESSAVIAPMAVNSAAKKQPI